MRRLNDTGTVIGALTLAGAGLLFGAVVTRAMVGAPTTSSLTGATDVASEEIHEASAPVPADLPEEVLRLAAERAPFEPDRRAPSERYRLPSERVVERPPVQRPAEPPPMPPFRVLGTIGGPEGGVAVIEAEGQRPLVLATGQELLGYTVKSVQGDAVVVSSQGWDVSLSVEAARSGAAFDGRSGQGARGRDAERAQQERAVLQARERLQEMARQLQQQTGGPVQMEIQGDRAILVGPDGVRRVIEMPGAGGNQGTVIVRPPPVRPRPGGGS
jgi:hypothetical protein